MIDLCKEIHNKPIYHENKLTLYHYSATPKPTSTPLLIVFASVNRPYILDLTDQCSFIKELLKQNIDIYLIDWGYPDENDLSLTLADHITGYLKNCVRVIQKTSHHKKINLLGICQGGVFSLCYSAIYPANIKNLILLATPIDFHTADNILSNLLQSIDIDLMVSTFGNIPGVFLTQFFLNLKPFELLGRKYLQLFHKLNDEKTLKHFFAMEKWIYDNPDQPGQAFREFIKECYQQNNLIKNNMKIGKYKINLAKISMPILNITGEADHLVPPSASYVLKNYISSTDYRYLSFPSGHIGLYVSNRTRSQLVNAISEWLKR